MSTRRYLFLIPVSLLLFLAASPAANLAFSYVAKGDPLPDMVLHRSGGGEASYLGTGTDQVRVFAFIKPGQERSAQILAGIDTLVAEFKDRPVHWALVASDRHGTAGADSLARAYPALPLFIDHGDSLYGTLGVALTPVVGLGNAEGFLHAYLPYRKIHFSAVLRAHLQFLLGDIDAATLAAVLHPVKQRVRDTTGASCHRALKLAEFLIKGGKTDRALIQVERVLGDCPDLPEAYTALAKIRRLQGDDEGAKNALLRAGDLQQQSTH